MNRNSPANKFFALLFIFIASIFLTSSFALAQEIVNKQDGIHVDTIHSIKSLGIQEFIVDVRQTEAMASPRKVPLSFFLQESNLPLNSIVIGLEEWEEKDKEICSTCDVEYNSCSINGNETTCSPILVNEQNCAVCGTETIQEYRWEEAKSYAFQDKGNKLETEAVMVNLPKYNPEEPEDSFKRFKIITQTPIEVYNGGYGSTGTFYINIDGNIFYDKSHSSYWNITYRYMQILNITLPAGATIPLRKDVTLSAQIPTATFIGAGKLQADCDDLKVIYQNTTELDFQLRGCGTDTAEVLWKIQENISAGSNNYDYSIYYGNADVEAIPYDLKNVYRYYTNFSDESIGSLPAYWNETDSGICKVSVDGLTINITVGDVAGDYCNYSQTLELPYRAEVYGRSTQIPPNSASSLMLLLQYQNKVNFTRAEYYKALPSTKTRFLRTVIDGNHYVYVNTAISEDITSDFYGLRGTINTTNYFYDWLDTNGSLLYNEFAQESNWTSGTVALHLWESAGTGDNGVTIKNLTISLYWDTTYNPIISSLGEEEVPAPVIAVKTLAPSSPTTTNDMICTFNFTNTNEAEIEFYINDLFTYNQNVSDNGSLTLDNGNTTDNDNIVCQIKAYGNFEVVVENTTISIVQNSTAIFNNPTESQELAKGETIILSADTNFVATGCTFSNKRASNSLFSNIGTNSTSGTNFTLTHGITGFGNFDYKVVCDNVQDIVSVDIGGQYEGGDIGKVIIDIIGGILFFILSLVTVIIIALIFAPKIFKRRRIIS